MNDQIKQLAEQAGYLPDSFGIGHWDMPECKKFAELIVKECAKICDDIGRQARKDWKAKYDPADDGRCSGAWECEEAILEYFGVDNEQSN